MSSMSVRAGVTSAVMLSVLRIALFAQVPAKGTVVGAVRSASDSSIKASVVVRAPMLGVSVVADSSGRFRLPGVPGTSVFLEIRRVGIQPLDTIVDVTADPVNIWVHEAAHELDTVSVKSTAPASMSTAPLAQFEARRAEGGGRFITGVQLRQSEDRDVVDVLRSFFPGLAFEEAVDGVHAYNPTTQPVGALRGSNNNAGGKCYVQIVVDGLSIYQLAHDADARMPPPDIRQYQTRSLGGVEYYSNPSRLPPELRTSGSTCGVLVFWSVRG